MKRILVAFFAFVLATSCSHKETFKVGGIVSDSTFEGSKVYLVALDGPVSKNVDSTVVTNGSFFFEKNADSLRVKILRVPFRYPYSIEDLVVVLEPGNLNVVLSGNSSGDGTRLNNILQDWKIRKRYNDSIQVRIYAQMQDTDVKQETKDSLLKISESLNKEYKSDVMHLLDKNIHNGIGLLLFKIYYHDLSAEAKKRILDITGNLYLEKDAQLKLMVKNDPDIKK